MRTPHPSPPGTVPGPASRPGDRPVHRPVPDPAHGQPPCGQWTRRAAPLCLAALWLWLAAGCAVAPLVFTGVYAGGSIVGAEVEQQQQKDKPNDNWNYADEYFARGRNQTGANAWANGTAQPGPGQPAFTNQPVQDANRTRATQPPAQPSREAVSIPMPGDRGPGPEKSRKPAP